jgi:hypothetical protein
VTKLLDSLDSIERTLVDWSLDEFAPSAYEHIRADLALIRLEYVKLRAKELISQDMGIIKALEKA